MHIAEPHEMPVDQHGNRADIIMDPNSTVNRMNIGRVFEMYINAASRDLHKLLYKTLGICPTSDVAKKGKVGILEYLTNREGGANQNEIDCAWNLLLGYYKIVSPKMYEWCINGQITQTREEYLADILVMGVNLYLPPDNQPESIDIVKQIESGVYRPLYGPVTYIGNSGNRVTTLNPIRIASMYFILLEKTGDDWASVSSCKLSHFGVLSQITRIDKFSKPSRNQAVRGAGEAEVRIFSSYVGEKFTAEMMDRNNNPKTHKHMVKGIISADEPTDITNLVDRDVLPYGNTKPLALLEHLACVGGWGFAYKPYVPTWNK